MAKKPANKAKASKPAKASKSKPATKKPVAKSKPAPKKASKPVAKKIVAKKVVAKKVVAKKPVKPVVKKIAKPIAKKIIPAKVVKVVKAAKPVNTVVKTAKPEKEIKKVIKIEPKGEKEVAPLKSSKKADKSEGKKPKMNPEDMIGEEVEMEDPIIEAEMDVPEMDYDDDDDDNEPKEARGKGRPPKKKKGFDKKHYDSEHFSKRTILKVDLSKPLIKKLQVPQPKPFINDSDKRTRYADAELQEFKEIIHRKLQEAKSDYELLKQTLSHKDDHGTDDTSPSFKLLEDGSDVLSKEETAQLAARQEKYIISLQNALIRIENKTYGICRVTGKLIPKERLRSVPHATLGIDAKLNQRN